MKIPSKKKIAFFQSTLHEFWKREGRHYLSWRLTDDPWKLILAEVLLRKTTTQQAEEVFNELQNLEPHDIIKIRSSVLESILFPLGMSKIRADQLKNIALAFSSATAEDLKSDGFLISLSGVGRYISNMVRCCAFGTPLPGLDTNMIRILQRFFGWESKRSRAREDRDFWDFAESLVPSNNPKAYNWAVMDFGAFICTKRNPKCDQCPLNGRCFYFENILK